MGERKTQIKDIKRMYDFLPSVDSALLCPEVFSQCSENIVAFPGFCDVHVHFREPGFSYKEKIATGSAAAARGGYTAVCTMPNLSPVPDSVENLLIQREIIGRDAVIDVLPYGAITVGERGEALADLEGMAKDVVAFSAAAWGAWSVAIMSIVPSAMPSSSASRSSLLLRGGFILKRPSSMRSPSSSTR